MTKVWAVSLVKDEADIIGFLAPHLFSQGISGWVVSDNMSSDGTRELLRRMAEDFNMLVVSDAEIAWHQDQSLTSLAATAAQMGADWILPVDADELHYAPRPGATVAQVLAQQEASVHVVNMTRWNHYATLLDHEDDPNPFTRMGWREKITPLWKVAYRYRPEWIIDHGSHRILDQTGRTVDASPADLGVRHFPYRSADQMITKVRNAGEAIKAASGLRSDMCAHLRELYELLVSQGEEALRHFWKTEFWFRDPEGSGLVRDPAPYGRAFGKKRFGEPAD